tara:strand:- start:55885 stop:57276 length:1392 start_codon:yes stop_codon:yes gene_type:complete
MSSVRKFYVITLLSVLLICISTGVARSVEDYQNANTVVSLDKDTRLNIKLGQSLFERTWVTAPSSTHNADGLGPLYNARSCSACHPDNGRAGVPSGFTGSTGFLVRVDIPPQDQNDKKQLLEKRINNVPEPVYGIQLQNFAIPGHPSEYQLTVEYTEHPLTFADGSLIRLIKPDYQINELGYGPLHPQARFSLRLAPQITGLGLLEAIDEQDILKHADPEDKDDDGISGRPNWVWSHSQSKVSLGRFGYKAGMPSINEQVQHAFLNDIGLSVPLFNDASGDCTVKQVKCQLAPNGNSPEYDRLEAGYKVVELVNLYITHLSQPVTQKIARSKSEAGEKLFNEIGCQRCHIPQYITGNKTQAKENHQRKIFPYTDMLLHDMGEGLADNRPEGDATGREWRTAPLWGIGSTVNSKEKYYYLHDGRARSIMEAILWHGGEAQSQRDSVLALDQTARKQLLTFLEGL